MNKKQFDPWHRQRVHGIAGSIPTVRQTPVIGRITLPTVMPRVPLDNVRWNPGQTVLPSGFMIPVIPLYMLYVFRHNGLARMIVNRVDPFQYEQMVLTELEMTLVMNWAMGMMRDDIGRFTPCDGGWFWWRK